MDWELTRSLAITLGVGLLIGIQREWAEKRVAGIRTFPLIALFGFLCGLGSESYGPWLVPTGLGTIAALLYVVNRNSALLNPNGGLGITTEVAVLLMYLLGALIAVGQVTLAVVVTGIVAVLLHLKRGMHGFVARIGNEEFRALIRLILIGMIILPILPDRGFGPFAVWNPFRIWLIVVLIVGISLAAFVVRRLLSRRAGVLWGGLLGGLISSTAITISTSRESRRQPGTSVSAAVVVMIASTVSLARILVEIAVVAPSALAFAGPPLGALFVWMTLLSALIFFRSHRQLEAPSEKESPPGDLGASIVFALLYAGVLFGVAVVQQRFGDRTLFVVAGLSGLTDVDAITLSVAELMTDHDLDPGVGWRAILIAAAANLGFKGAVAAVMGSGKLAAQLALLFGLSIAGAAAIFFLWP